MTKTASTFSEIDILFHPRAVAVIGASNKPSNQGRMFLQAINNPQFKGDIYAVHPYDTVAGYKTYRNVQEIPGPVDHLIVSVPAAASIDVIADCGRKGVRSAALFTSGFAEEGTDEGMALQIKLVEAARKSKVRLIGPNCMGFYCPETGLSFRHDLPMRAGPVAFVAQSGGVCMTGIFILDSKGLGISKAISYGNESDLGAPELLRYSAQDPETKAILLYVEGTRDGPEIVEALKFAASRKPVAVLKGGMTVGGMKAASSHTGAMAGSSEIWEAAARQAKAPMVPSMDELVDAAQAYVRLKKPSGPRIGLVTISGGFGVFATDILSKGGFEIPSFSAKTSEELTRLIKRPGTSVRNPVDMAATFFQLKKYPQLFTSLDSDPNIDMFVVLLAIEYTTYMEEEFLAWANIFADHLINAFKLMKKPLAVVFFQTTLNEKRIEIERHFIEAGFPVFPTVERCANALVRRMICVA